MAKKSTEPPSRGSWPKVEKQLAAAKAIHGSAYEKFIRANQETHLLPPRELEDDGIGYPLWLRVYYRKQHPDEPPPAGPARDYPERPDSVSVWGADSRSDVLFNTGKLRA